MENLFQGNNWETEAMVLISLDKMSATINLPAPEDGLTYNIEDIIEFLKKNGIKQGIDIPAIQNIISKQLYYMDVCIANGRTAVSGTDGRYVLDFRTTMPVMPKELPDGTVDYLNMDLFEIVKRGQKIAHYIPATKGEFGFTVTGDLLIPKHGKELKPLRGKGFVIAEDRKTYFSSLDGRITFENNRLEISHLLLIPGDVDLSTGNLKFDGDIYVKGDVLSGLKVEATGDIQICGHVENSTLKSGGTLVIKNGMQGAGNGSISADGDIYGNFFEAVNIQAKGEVHTNYLMNCFVSTDGTVCAAGKKGAIIGGRVQAVKGISAFTYGNRAEIATVLESGISQDSMKHYNELRMEMTKIDSELKIFEQGKSTFEAKMAKAVLEAHNTYTKILQAIQIKKKERQECVKQMRELLIRLSADEEVRIVARGTVYAGVSVIIDTYELKLNNDIANVFFVRKDNRVAMYKLK